MGLAPSESDSGGAQWLLRGHEKRLLKVPGIRQLIIRIGGLTRGAKVYRGQWRQWRKWWRRHGLPVPKNGLLQPIHTAGSEGRQIVVKNDSVEVLHLFDFVGRHEGNPLLCHALRLVRAVPRTVRMGVFGLGVFPFFRSSF
jgi:hypothetical protein